MTNPPLRVMSQFLGRFADGGQRLRNGSRRVDERDVSNHDPGDPLIVSDECEYRATHAYSSAGRHPCKLASAGGDQ